MDFAEELHQHTRNDAVEFEASAARDASMAKDIEEIKRTLVETNKTLVETRNELNAFRAEIAPYLQGVAGLGIAWKGLIALGGLVLLWAQIKGIFR